MAQESQKSQQAVGDNHTAATQQQAAPTVPQPPTTNPPQSAPTTSRPCPQDCTRCLISQQVYCSTKMLFDLSRAYQETRQQMAEMLTAVAAAKAAIADIQSQIQPKEGEAPLSTPFIEAT